MTQATVAADFGEPLDVHRGLTAQVTFDGVLVLDDFTELCFVIFGQVLDAGIRVDTGLCQDLLGSGQANALDIGQSNFNSLFAGQVNTSNTCHASSAPPISLVSACAWGFRKLPLRDPCA